MEKDTIKKMTVKVPFETYRKLKLFLIDRGMSFQDYVLNLIEEDIKKDSEK